MYIHIDMYLHGLLQVHRRERRELCAPDLLLAAAQLREVGHDVLHNLVLKLCYTNATLYYPIILYYTILYYTILYYIILYYTIPYYTIHHLEADILALAIAIQPQHQVRAPLRLG